MIARGLAPTTDSRGQSSWRLSEHMTLSLQTKILLASIMLALSAGSARADRIVEPLVSGNAATAYPFGISGSPSMRYQQVYVNAPILTAAPQGVLITKIAFDKAFSVEFVSH